MIGSCTWMWLLVWSVKKKNPNLLIFMWVFMWKEALISSYTLCVCVLVHLFTGLSLCVYVHLWVQCVEYGFAASHRKFSLSLIHTKSRIYIFSFAPLRCCEDQHRWSCSSDVRDGSRQFTLHLAARAKPSYHMSTGGTGSQGYRMRVGGLWMLMVCLSDGAAIQCEGKKT